MYYKKSNGNSKKGITSISFIRDEKGVIDLIRASSHALAVVGFIVFNCRLYPGICAYQERSFIAGHYQDASNFCGNWAKDESLAGSRSRNH